MRSIAGTNSAEASVGVLSTNAFGAVDMMGAGVNLAALRGLASTAGLVLTPGGVLVAATGVMMYNDHQANLNLANKLLAANRSGFSVIDQEFVTRYGNIDDVLDDPVALALYRDALNKEIEKKSVEFAMNSAAGGSQILWTPIAEERGPQILSTPIHSRAVEPLTTPDERERLDDERKQELKTGGFRAHEGPAFENEGFDVHETDWRDNVLFSKKYIDELGNERYEDSHGSRTFNPAADGNHISVKRDVRFGKLYQDKDDEKIWWSKDRAGHGGAHWKKFEKIGHELIHEADVDTSGKVMLKHKGPKGKKIDFNNLIGIK